MTGTEWTPERIARLRALAAKGLTSGEIAKQMRISRGAVMGAIRRHGVRLKRQPTRGLRMVIRPKPSKPPKPPKPPASFSPPLGAGPAIAALKQGDCRWPYGDPAADDFHFCMKRSELNALYCREHAEAAVGKGATHGYKPWPMRRGP